MGLLEQLELEAEQLRRAALDPARERRLRTEAWHDRLLPAMRRLESHLGELVADLSLRRPTARMVATLRGYGEVVAYLDHDYLLRATPAAEAHALALDYSATVATDECPLVLAEGVAAVTAVASALWKQRLYGVIEAAKNAAGEATSARFQARGRILLGVHVEADLASGRARLTLSNLEGFGQTHRWLQPEQLTPALFETLGRFIARRDASFGSEPAAAGRAVRDALFGPLPRAAAPADASGWLGR